MAFDVLALSPFVNEQQFPLLTKALAGGRTAELMRKQLGVKGPTTVNLMDVDVNMAQAGATCSFSADGDVTFTQQTIDAKHVKINMEFCPKKLENYYLSTQLAPGAIQDSMPFEEVFSNYLIEKIQDEIEKIIWQGDGAGTSGTNLDMFDGILQQTASFTDCNTAAYNGSTLSSPLTVADMVEAIQRVYALSPSAAVAQNDFKIFCGLDKFRLMSAGLLDGSGLTSTGGQLANYASDFDPFRLVYPGTNIEVIGVNGLTGLNGVYGASLNNLVLGLDLDTDTSAGLEVWYSKDNRSIRVACEFIMGTAVSFPDQVGKVAV